MRLSLSLDWGEIKNGHLERDGEGCSYGCRERERKNAKKVGTSERKVDTKERVKKAYK